MKQQFGSISHPARAVLLAFVLTFSILGMAFGQNERSGPPIIRSVEVQYVGPATISKERVLAQLRLKAGQPYSETLAEQDIRALYATGAVQNVRIFAEPERDGAKLIVVIQTRSLVNEIEIVGAQSLSPKKLRKRINLKINGRLGEEDLEDGRQRIIEAYQEKGFTNVDVKYHVDTDEAHGTSRVVYEINEGEKGTVSSIRFEGNTKFSDRTLRKQMKTKGKTLYSMIDKSGRLDENQLEQDLNAIREWYQNHGYIDFEIKDVRRDRSQGRMTITVVLVEGPQYHIGRISIVGTKIAPDQKVRALLRVKEGNVYSPKAIREDSKRITDAYGTGGYVDVSVLPEGLPSGHNIIDLKYTIDEGIPSFVQRITIVGNTRTKDKVIRREVLISPGDTFNSVRVETTKKRLDNLGYFSKVETYPEDTGVNGRKDLIIQVDEKRTGSLNFGAGFSTIDNLVGFIELTQGNFDLLNWPTFTGAGQKFRLRLQYGTSRKDFIFSLIEPYFLDRRLSLGGTLYFSEADYLSSEYSQRTYGFDIDLRKPIAAFTALNLQYRFQGNELFDVSSESSAIIQAQAAQGVITESRITPSIVFDSRDNPFLSRRGLRAVLTPYISGGFLGGDTQIYGVSLEAAQFFHFWKDTILQLQGAFATVDNWGDGNYVPIYDRLFLGGSNDLRGFGFRDVSPRDITGEPIGGKTSARFTIEYTLPIIEKARFAVFYDTGFVNLDSWDVNTSHVASDIGVGLRLDLPIGPIRIDYGIPIQKDVYGGGGRFNFNVGYQF